jgi:hypothetical protein
MEWTMTGSSTQGAKILLHPVSDLESAKTVHTALLGVAPQVADWPPSPTPDGNVLGLLQDA